MTTDADLPVWTFRPDWQQDVTERLSFKTDVLASTSGAEQRRGLRSTPRRTFEFDLTLFKKERAFFDLAQARLSGGEWLLPIWHDVTGLTSAAAIGDSTLALPTDLREFKEGGFAVLIANAFTYERVQIDSLTSDSLTLADPLTKAWGARAKVYPCRRGRVDDQAAMSRKTDTAATGTVGFLLLGEQTWTGSWSPDMFLGYPVLSVQPNQTDDLDYKFYRLFDEIDNDTGVPERVDLADRAFNSFLYRWLIHGRPANAAFRSLLYALDGKRKALWMPSFNDDLSFVQRAFSDAGGPGERDYIEFQTAQYRTMRGGAGPIDGRDHLRICYKDGTFSYHQILGTDISGTVPVGSERLVLTPWLTAGGSASIPPIKSVQFIDLMRLDSDDVELTHLTDAAGTTTVEATFKSFREPDAPVVQDKGQNGQASFGGHGICIIYEIESPHNDPDLLFQGYANVGSIIVALGGDPHDARTLTFTTDQDDVTALALFTASDVAAPSLSAGWTSDGSGVFVPGSDTYAFVAGHEAVPDRATAVSVTCTWPNVVQDTTGLLVLLNKAKIIQSTVGHVNTVGFAEFDDDLTPGNWLIQLQISQSAGIANTGIDPHWERRLLTSPPFSSYSIQIFTRRLPG